MRLRKILAETGSKDGFGLPEMCAVVETEREAALETPLDRSAFATEFTVGGVAVQELGMGHAIVLGALLSDGRNADEKVELSQKAKDLRRQVEAEAERQLREYTGCDGPRITHEYDEQDLKLRSRAHVWPSEVTR